ncbi:MAG: ribosome small subunit-dependent GTPase A [Chitinispirillales bacterium]|jgi:ribosome biogenesis GTPase|nr:ribosome small subunit-dependent GTPase A [Chitinispirillales bacterium]
MNGRIIQEQKNYYLADISQNEPVRAVLKGVAKSKHKRIVVGDFVKIQLFDGITDTAVIRDILPRINELSKPAIANIDNIFFVNCLVEPILNFLYIDKFLFCACVKKINATLIFNKTDILSKTQFDVLQNFAKTYEEFGFQVLLTSVNDKETIDKIKNTAKDKVSVFAGQSGVGKSSIMQILFPDKHFAVQELSQSLLRGKNTTSHTSLIRLENGGYIADTPGFSVFEMPAVPPEFVCAYFDDFAKILQNKQCKFSNCSHKNEPKCCIRNAVETGEIANSRYESYLVIYDEMAAKSRKF